jgi:1,4-dihydroxy-2-naphthoyl-CoA synthase
MQYEDILYELRNGAAWIIIEESREGVKAFQEERKPDFRRWVK